MVAKLSGAVQGCVFFQNLVIQYITQGLRYDTSQYSTVYCNILKEIRAYLFTEIRFEPGIHHIDVKVSKTSAIRPYGTRSGAECFHGKPTPRQSDQKQEMTLVFTTSSVLTSPTTYLRLQSQTLKEKDI